jgi:hypothetical protein
VEGKSSNMLGGRCGRSASPDRPSGREMKRSLCRRVGIWVLLVAMDLEREVWPLRRWSEV